MPELNHLLQDDDAVSPVIGVILMVAITVILAAVIATFVLGLGEQVSDTGPNASFSFDFENTSTTSDDFSGTVSGDANLTVTHAGGPNIDSTQLSLSGSSAHGSSVNWDTAQSGEVEAGKSVTLAVNYGDTINVVWENEESTESLILQRFNVPD